MQSLVISLIVRYLLAHAGASKDQARAWIKDQLDGCKEKLALAVFDVAWDIAVGVVGSKAGSVPFANEAVYADVARISNEVDKQLA